MRPQKGLPGPAPDSSRESGRRASVRGGVALSVVLVLVGLVFALMMAACGEEEKADGGQQAQGKQVAIFAYTREPITEWDPAVEFAEGIITLQNVYECLLKYDPAADEFTPVLATEYERSDDGLTWTFKIRKGVKFHDGTDLDAEAVKYSLDRTIKIGKGAAYILDSVKEIAVVDPYTVEFRLKEPAPMDIILAAVNATYILSPTAAKSHPDDWFTQGNECGTGPYMLEDFQAGQQVILTRFDDYWKGWEGNHFDKVIIKAVPEAATKRQLISKGDIDITMELPPEDIEALKKDPNVNVMIEPSFQNLFLVINTKKKPMDNVLVRQAMCYAYPYEDVIKYALGGMGSQSRGSVPVGLWGHGDDIFQYTTDLAKAKELMEQSGVGPGPHNVEFAYASGDEAQRKSAELWKANLDQIGINLQIRPGPWGTIWDRATTADAEDAQGVFSLYDWPDACDPMAFVQPFFRSDGVLNFGYWSNPEADKLMDEARRQSGLDRKKAAELYVEAQRIIVEEAVCVFTFDQQYAFVLAKDFKGYKPNPAYPHVVWFYDCYREE